MKTTLKTLLAIFTITSGFVLHTADPKNTSLYSPSVYKLDSLIGIKYKDFARIVIGNVGNTSTDEKSTKEYIVPITPQGQDELLSNLHKSNAPDFIIEYAKGILGDIERIINHAPQQSRIIDENTTMFMLTDQKTMFELIKKIESLASIDGVEIKLHENDKKDQKSIGSRVKSVLSYIPPMAYTTTLTIAQICGAIFTIDSFSKRFANVSWLPSMSYMR